MDTPEVYRLSSRHSDVIERSLERLDEALQSPSGILRSRAGAGRPAALRHFDRRSLTSRRGPKADEMDLTVDITNMTAATGVLAQSMLDNVTVNDSILGEPEISKLLSQTLCTDDDPGEQALSELLDEFLATMQRYPAQHEVFEQLDGYRELTERHVERLGQLLLSVPAQRGATQFTDTKRLHHQLSKERNTWRLLSALYRDRLLVHSDDADAMLVDSVGRPQSDRTIAGNLFKCDTSVRQAQIVVDWLEACAADDLVSGFSEKVEFFGDTAVAWENTLHALQSGTAGRNMVRSMDPDAAIREGAQLHHLDQEDERRLLRYMFVLLRAGRLDEAQRLCLRVGQPWRAAALEGWKLHHDPNLDQPAAAPQPVEGNPLRDLWKLAAWHVSEDARLDLHERAVMAALCGNLSVLLSVCRSWEDRVWAHFKVYVDCKVESEIRSSTQSLRQLDPLPVGYPQKSSSPAAMFAEVAALERERRDGDQVARLYNSIQRCAVLGEEPEMLAEMAAFCEEQRGNEQLHRSLAHLALFVRAYSGADISHQHCVTVLEAYVRCLVEQRSTPLVARYAALLPPAEQTRWYAALMEMVTEPTERLETLRLAEQAGLDAAAAALAVVQTARKRPVSPSDALTPETTEDDRRCIDAVKWLLLDPAQRLDAIREANAVCRRLLLAHKLPAARQLIRQVPEDSIATVLELWRSSSGQQELPPDQDSAVKEHLCVKALLLGQDAHTDWSEQLYHQRPQEPELRAGASFTEKVAHEQRLKQYQSNLERWKAAHVSVTQTTSERLYNILLFPDGGWMSDRPLPPTAAPHAAADDTDDSERQREMAGLRKLYIPQTVSLLHAVLHGSGKHKEATQLADLVAGEQYQLYKEFTQAELQHFIGKLRETSMELLDQNLDALAYPFQ